MDPYSSYLNKSFMVPDMIAGIPQDWFFFSYIPYILGLYCSSPKIGILGFFVFLGFGWILARYYDVYFASVLKTRLQYNPLFSLIRIILY